MKRRYSQGGSDRVGMIDLTGNYSHPSCGTRSDGPWYIDTAGFEQYSIDPGQSSLTICSEGTIFMDIQDINGEFHRWKLEEEWTNWKFIF